MSERPLDCAAAICHLLDAAYGQPDLGNHAEPVIVAHPVLYSPAESYRCSCCNLQSAICNLQSPMPRIYIAGPLFNTHERWYLERIAEALEGVGYTTFLPHRDAGLVDFTAPGAQAHIFRADITALDGCDLCVALLTGADQDSGTSAELGYMFAQGKPCFGLSDDFRYLNNMIWGICGEGGRIAKDISGVLELLAASSAPAAAVADRATESRIEAILRRRNAEFLPAGNIAPASLQTVIWTLDELLEEAEDSDFVTRDTSRVRDLTITRDLLTLLQRQASAGDAGQP